ncbi:MAG: hypothetical protein Q9169_000099 [Polycauliona sp. 2 TL-2023]
MGNFPSAPRYRPQPAYALREGAEKEILEMARSLRIEAEQNTRLIQQKYERREKRYRAGTRPDRHAADRERSTSDDSSRRGGYPPGPEPGGFEYPDMMGDPNYPIRRGRSGNRHRPPKAFHSHYRAGREEPGLDDYEFEGIDPAARNPAEQYPDMDRQGQMAPQKGGPRQSPGEAGRR